jgi:uncharacterized cupredoxin-like copper-binding protein
MRTHRIWAAAFTGLVLTLAACSPAASPTPSGTTITGTLTEYKIALSATTAPAGKITFNVTNAGSMIHEFVILKTETLAAALPLVNDKVNEDAYNSSGEVSETDPSKSGTVTVDLAAGHYAIICNLAGHVRQGMVLDFTVQ